VREGWNTQPLGELCEFSRGLTYAKSDEVEFSNNVVLRATNIDLATGLLDFSELRYIRDDVAVPDSRKVKKDSLMICTASGSRSHLGKVALVDEDYGFAFGGFMGLIEPKSALMPKYLFYLMTSEAYAGFLGGLSGGTNINNLKFSDLKQFPVPYPSLPEQRRVVAMLDEVFEGIATAKASAERNLQSAQALFESELEVLLAGRVEGWAENTKPLADLCELIVDCEHKTAPTQEDGTPSIRTPNVGKGRLLLDGVYRVGESTYREWTRRATPAPGDLILAREAPAGNVAVIPDGTRVCLGQRTVLIRPRRSVFEPDFLALMLLQRRMQKRLLAHSRGATVEHVNMKDIRALSVSPIPPLSVQRDLVLVMSEARQQNERLEVIFSEKLAALEALKQSLLHQAFTGQLGSQAA
jgi:type I restriction enzyme S subunit